jgi:hypothetical protein
MMGRCPKCGIDPTISLVSENDRTSTSLLGARRAVSQPLPAVEP